MMLFGFIVGTMRASAFTDPLPFPDASYTAFLNTLALSHLKDQITDPNKDNSKIKKSSQVIFAICGLIGKTDN